MLLQQCEALKFFRRRRCDETTTTMAEELDFVANASRTTHHQNVPVVQEEGFFGSCDFTSYCYFFLAVVLFTVGTVVTIYALDVGSVSLFSNMSHMWLAGPIFISSGFMVAVKTVLYLRKKNLVSFIIRQSAMFRELQNTRTQYEITRNASTITLPPSYDSAVGQYILSGTCSSEGYFELVHRQLSLEEAPPPSYEDAMLLLSGETGIYFNRRIADRDGERSVQVTEKDVNG